MSEPRKRTATEAMRLKPATQPRPCRSVRELGDEIESCELPAGHTGDHRGSTIGWRETTAPADAAARLEAVLALHRPGEIGVPAHCVECLLPHPCDTRRAATGEPAAPTPREDSTQ